MEIEFGNHWVSPL